METFPIYTFGGGEILGHIFNGMAMIFQSDNDYFTPVAELAMLVGGLWAALRAIYGYNIGIFGKQWFVPTFLILTVFFTPKSTVHIIDQANPGHQYEKVDNIPSGIALVASVASNISHHVTEMIEQHIRPLDSDVYTYSKTGPLFGAKILSSTKDLRLSNPNMRENVKKFMNQCYTWPSIITNIAGKRLEATQTDDILAFVTQEAHPSLGMYWDGEDGTAEFKACSAAVPLVLAALTQNQDKALLDLATMTGFSGSDPSAITGKMQQYGGDAWNEITQESKTVHQITNQQMLMNAYREGYDDMREAQGHHRLYPHLVSMQATRGIMQQNMGWMVGGAIAAEYLPIAQTVIFALLICSIFIVLPMSMMPGGLSVIGGWIKMIFWVQSWPIFFAILSAIGGFALQQRIISVGTGLNILTQSAFADVAFNTYCMVQNLLLAVPFISWAILNKGGHALVSMAERIAPSGIGNSMGSSMVDNTHSFDNVSAHNRTISTEQVAQQNSGAMVNTGFTFDEGTFSTKMDGSGSQISIDQTSQLRNNISLMDAENASLSSQSEKSLQFSKTQANEASKQDSFNTSQAVDLVERWGHGVSGIEGYSESQNVGVSESLQRLNKQGISVSDAASISDMTKSSMNASAGYSVGAFGANASANVSAESSASNQDSKEFRETSDQTIDDINQVQEVLTLAKTGGVTTTDDSSANLSESTRSSYDRVQQLRESSSASKAESDRYAAAAGHTYNIGSQVSTNINDEVLGFVAQKKFGGDTDAAARWQRSHSSEFKANASEYLNQSGFTGRVLEMSESGNVSKESIEQAWTQSKKDIKNENPDPRKAHQEHSTEIKKIADTKSIDPGALKDKQRALEHEVNSRKSSNMKKSLDDKLAAKPIAKKNISENHKRLKEGVRQDRDTNTLYRAGKNMVTKSDIDERTSNAPDKI